MKIFNIMICMLAIISCRMDSKDPSRATSANALLQDWDTPFGTPPLDKIASEDYLPAFKNAMKMHREEVQRIAESAEVPTFENTVVALEQSGSMLKRVQGVFDAVQAANTNDVLKATSKEVRPLLAAHYDQIEMNKTLFDRIQKVYANRDRLGLDAEDQRLLSETHKSFVRSGVNLPDERKKRLKAINKRLATLSQQFDDNLLAETNDFDLYVTEEKDLGDLPDNFKEAAAEEAKKRGHASGWSFTLQRPSMYPFLDYSPNRAMRKKILDGYAQRANNDNEHDNKAVIEEMVRLRTERAQLLGYASHAEYVLADRMAERPQRVYDLLDKIWKPALETAERDRDLLAARMKADGIDGTFGASDWRYYVRKIREEKYNFDEDQTRPYFEANAVRDGALALATRLFGLSFKKRDDIATWHEDQQVYEVLDQEKKHLGIIYFDFYARPSKRGGAWMNEIRPQSNVDQYVTPIVTNNFNFPAPTAGAPSLLSFSQAQTVFHEFGHGLHGLLSDVKYASLSGTNVPRDFVEFPSQVIENWMAEPKVLKEYAKHYKTGEVIPDAMIKKMKQANGFDEGFRTVEYMAAAYLDMDWHTVTDTLHRATEDVERSSMGRIGLIPEILPRYRSTYFAHIAGGYSAGYYSYIWSEILDADAFKAFVDSGDVLNPQLAKKYEEMLASGGTKSGMALYKDFRGREPKIEALLQRKGFL